jgi:hypothetical protein
MQSNLAAVAAEVPSALWRDLQAEGLIAQGAPVAGG